MMVICDKCKRGFDVEKPDLVQTEIKGLEIHYFVCSNCGKKYVVYAADVTMKGLSDIRAEYERQIRVAVLKKFRKKRIDELTRKVSEIKARQLMAEPRLKREAEKLLEEADG